MGDSQASRLKGATNQADRLRSAGQRNPIVDFSQQLLGGVLDVLDIPARMFVGPEEVAARRAGEEFQRPSLREAAGLPARTETLAGRAGVVAGETLTAAVPLGKAAGMVREAPKAAGRIRRGVQEAVRGAGAQFRAAPVRTTLKETALGAAAGAGGFIAQERFPDTTGAQFVGEILGGVAPGVALGAAKEAGRAGLFVAEKLPSIRIVANMARKGRETLKQAAARARTPTEQRVIRRFERAVGKEPKAAAAAMGKPLVARHLLTPAQLTGDTGLLALEKDLIKSTDKLKRRSDEQLNALNDAIKSSVILPGDPSITQSTFQDALDYFKTVTDARIKTAALKADERIERIIPGTGREQVNRIARTEIDDAFKAATAHENSLYNAIDPDALVGTSNSRSALARAINETAEAQAADVPFVARKFLSPDSDSFIPFTNIKELRGIQSELRRISRNARAGDRANFNKARIADSIADAIIEDIALMEGGGDAVKMAVGYSRYKSEVFRQGNVGKLLGFQVTGEGRIPPGLTLEATLGMGGPKAREAVDDIIQATANPDIRKAMDDFIRKDFMTSAIREGQLNRDAAVNYLTRNQELLNRVPNIRDEIKGAIDANDASVFTQRTAERIDLNKSKAALFIRDDPKKLFSSFIDSRGAERQMQKLVNMTKRDRTGQALQGLKSSFSEFVLDKITGKSGVVSGEDLRRFMVSPQSRSAMETLYSRKEMVNMNRVLNTAIRLDKALAAKTTVEGILGDPVSQSVKILAGLIGAVQGTKVANLLRGGRIAIPQMMADRFRALTQAGIANPAERLIEDALQDETLFKEILLRPITGELPREAMNRLNAWVAGVLIDAGLTEGENNESR